MKYITTPIYYANGEPHIGSAYTTLAADIFARYWRLKGDEVFFLTGTDEHGAKIAEAAEQAGKAPQTFTDAIANTFKHTWQRLNIQPDGFIRTTDAAHKGYVQRFLQELYDTGAIYKGEYKGWYCVGCEEFKTETQIGPGNTCPIHLKPLIEVAEESYMFKLSAYQDQLRELIAKDVFKIRPEERKNEVLCFIDQGLRDVAISRKSVSWGVAVPWDESHTVYVWIDALLNYLSAADANGPEFASAKRPTWPPTLQLVGKDILRFHAVIWPALLLAADKVLPGELFVHGFFTLNGHKISKSLDNVITPEELIERYGVDGARYLLAKLFDGSDSDITWERFDDVYNSDLANSFGNLVNRVQTMLLKYRDGTVPISERPGDVINQVDSLTCSELDFVDSHVESRDLFSAIEQLQTSVDWLNGFIEEHKPWGLAKEGKEAELSHVLAVLSESIYVLGALFAPYIPGSAEKILTIFGASLSNMNYGTLGTVNHTAGKTIQPIPPLFPRLATE